MAGAPPEAPDSLNTPVDIAKFFQPVYVVVPPGSETWVVDKNAAYIEALAQLRHSMQDIADGGRNVDPAIYQAAGQNYDKGIEAVRQLARAFKPSGSGQPRLDRSAPDRRSDPTYKRLHRQGPG